MTVDAAVAEFRDRLDLERRLRPFEALRYRANDAGTRALHLDDFAAIPFLDGVSGVEHYQHRARLRARGGDSYVASTPASLGYERYCREVLGLGAVELLEVDPAGDRLAIARACMEKSRASGPVGNACPPRAASWSSPFLGAEAIWDLAAAVAAETGARVRVLAPPPPVTWIANDKANFEDLVMAVLGPGFLPESRRSASPEALARALLELSETGPSVALKRLRCASAMGNEVFESAALRRRGFSGTLDIVRGFLERTGWESGEDVLAVRWEPATSSPSTQWWLPPPGGGEPILDGVYEQILAGEEGVFVGSRPSGLAAEVEERIVSQSGAGRERPAAAGLRRPLLVRPPGAGGRPGRVHGVQRTLGRHQHADEPGRQTLPGRPPAIPGADLRSPGTCGAHVPAAPGAFGRRRARPWLGCRPVPALQPGTAGAVRQVRCRGAGLKPIPRRGTDGHRELPRLLRLGA